jgi:hypothetical protein
VRGDQLGFGGVHPEMQSENRKMKNEKCLRRSPFCTFHFALLIFAFSVPG